MSQKEKYILVEPGAQIPFIANFLDDHDLMDHSNQLTEIFLAQHLLSIKNKLDQGTPLDSEEAWLATAYTAIEAATVLGLKIAVSALVTDGNLVIEVVP